MKKGLLVGGALSASLLISGAFSVWAILHWGFEGWSATFCYLPMLALIMVANTTLFVSMETEDPEAFLRGFIISSAVTIVFGSALWWFSDLPMISPDAPNWRAFIIASPFLFYLMMNFWKKLRKYQGKDKTS